MNDINRMSEVAATLGNESRLVLLQLVAAGEKSVEVLSELSGIPVASTSQHLQVLKKSNMVITRREGKRILYRLQDGPLRELIDALERFVVFQTLKPGVPGFEPQHSISAKELQKKIQSKKIVIVDVRSREEFKTGHITGAVNIPFTDLKKSLSQLPKGSELVVYCRGPHCLLSVNALALLRAQGFGARRLVTGYSDWPGERTAHRGRR